MIQFYYQDDAEVDHFSKQQFATKLEAIAWGEELVKHYKPKNALLYTWEDKVEKIKEWSRAHND